MTQAKEACLGLPEDASQPLAPLTHAWQRHRCFFSSWIAFISMTSRGHWTRKESPLETSGQAQCSCSVVAA